MRVRERIVIDTNCLISRLLLPSSVPGQAVRRAVDHGVMLVSEATMNELADVLARSEVRPVHQPRRSAEISEVAGARRRVRGQCVHRASMPRS